VSGNDGALNSSQDENRTNAGNRTSDGGPLEDYKVDVPGYGSAEGRRSVETGWEWRESPQASSVRDLGKPSLSSGDNGKLSVDLDDLRLYTRQVALWKEQIGTVYRNIEALGPIKPGLFPKAKVLYTQVEDPGGLHESTKDFVLGVANSAAGVETGLSTVLTEFTSAEEFNKLTAARLGEEFGDGFSAINELSAEDSGGT